MFSPYKKAVIKQYGIEKVVEGWDEGRSGKMTFFASAEPRLYIL